MCRFNLNSHALADWPPATENSQISGSISTTGFGLCTAKSRQSISGSIGYGIDTIKSKINGLRDCLFFGRSTLNPDWLAIPQACPQSYPQNL